MSNPSRLLVTLQNTGLQQKDNPLYQVIRDIIQEVLSVSKVTTIISGGGSVGPQGIQGIQGVPGELLNSGDNIEDNICYVDFRNVGGIYTSGSVIFAGPSGIFAQDNANFFWDNVNKRLGIGINTPAAILDILQNINSTAIIQYTNPNAGTGSQVLINMISDAANTSIRSHALARVATRYGVVLGGFGELVTNGGNGLLIGTSTDAKPIIFGNAGLERLRIDLTGNIGITIISPTAYLHIKAGIAAAGNAPLKFTAGINLTSPEAGAIEWDGTNLFATQTTGPTRKTIAYTTDIPSLPSIAASTFEKAETGSDANVLTYTVGGTDQFLTIQVAVDVSALTGTSVAATVTWKDSNNATQTSTVTLSGVTDGSINIPINAKASTNVVVSTVFVGVSTAYNISAFITRFK